jgi:RNA-binding protein PNO1
LAEKEYIQKHADTITMPAPTALQRAPDALAQEEEVAMTEAPMEEEVGGVLLDPSATEETAATALHVQEPTNDTDAPMQIDEEGRPKFAPAKDTSLGLSKVETRKIAVPPHRFSPLKNNWIQIYTRTWHVLAPIV